MKTSTAPQLVPVGGYPTVPVPASQAPSSRSLLPPASPSSAPPESASRPILRSPLAKALSSLPPAPPPRQTMLTPVPAPTVAPPPPRPRVVVADPDPAARARVVQMLGDICDVEETAGGVLGATLCATGRVPAMLITDVTTPNAFTLAKLVKAHPRLKRVPVVFLSAKALPRDVVMAISLGARQCMNKESSTEELSAKLRRMITL